MGTKMYLSYLKSKQHLLIALFLLILASCKQSEFYDKAALLESGPNAKSRIGTEDGNNANNGSSNSADNGTITNPPLLTVPSILPTVTNLPAVGAPSVGSTSVGSTSVGSPSVGSPSVESPSVGSTSVGSTSVGSTSTGSTSVGSTSVGAPSVGSTSVGSTSVGSTSTGSTIPAPIVVSIPNNDIITICNNPVAYVSCPVIAPTPEIISSPVIAPRPEIVSSPVIAPVPEIVSNPVIAPTPVIAATPIVAAPVILNDRVENFIQDSSKNGDVDILWVIDDSGSMADNQDSLARNFNNFITQFLDKKIDFKMAITTTDGTSIRNGKMVGDSSKLTSASAIGNRNAFINNFTKWVKVGTSGSGIEQGLKTASSFLDRYAASYLRTDAYLAIVFLSDEEDQSNSKVTDYIARFQATKRTKGMVKAYSIVAQSQQSTKKWETLGLRYNQVSKATGGTISDISDDFSATLKDIGGSIVNLIDRFALAESPYQDKISVYVNNVKQVTGWSFDISTHSLKFNANAIPLEGARIEIRYQVKASVLGAI